MHAALVALKAYETSGPRAAAPARRATPAARRWPRSGARKTIESIAVLPLATASGDSELEYLADGITESVINALSQLPKLKVMARSTVFRYKGRDSTRRPSAASSACAPCSRAASAPSAIGSSSRRSSSTPATDRRSGAGRCSGMRRTR